RCCHQRTPAAARGTLESSATRQPVNVSQRTRFAATALYSASTQHRRCVCWQAHPELARGFRNNPTSDHRKHSQRALPNRKSVPQTNQELQPRTSVPLQLSAVQTRNAPHRNTSATSAQRNVCSRRTRYVCSSPLRTTAITTSLAN